jgi:hypothetical protein
MPVIFGKEVPTKTLWIGGGLMLAAVAVIVFLRARAGGSASPSDDQPPAEQGDFGGGGMSIGAPTGAIADDYQNRLNQSEIEAQQIANTYQRNLVAQQERAFNFEQAQAELLAPQLMEFEKARIGAETHYQKAAAKAAISCPGKASVRTDPATGQLYCREKTSGIPVVTDLIRTAEGVVYGARQAAPEIGYNVAKDAAAFYSQKTFPTVSRPAPKQPTKQTVPTKRTRIYEPGGSTPPISPTYGEDYI